MEYILEDLDMSNLSYLLVLPRLGAMSSNLSYLLVLPRLRERCQLVHLAYSADDYSNVMLFCVTWSLKQFLPNVTGYNLQTRPQDDRMSRNVVPFSG